MKKQFVTYEIALKLKELGFNEKCFAYYSPLNDEYMLFQHHNRHEMYHTFLKELWEENLKILPAPLWQQAIDWLREKKINIVLFPVNNQTEWFYGINVVAWQFCDRAVLFKTYEDAREQAILKALTRIQ